MADNQDYFERIQARSRNATGREMTAEEAAREFAKADMNTRLEHLADMETSMSAKGDLTLQEAAKLMEYESALRNTHHTLRKVGR